MGKKKHLTKKELAEFKQSLLVIREKIVSNLEHLEKDSLNKSQRDASGDLSGYSFHMADVATDSFDTEVHLGMASNIQHMLNEIDDALHRIEDGTYGFCEKYDIPIKKERLKVMPYTRYCIKAQEEEEQAKKSGHQPL